MKITFISDLHGEDLWKKAVERNSDLFIFLGDYFDSFTVSIDKQIENFKDLVYFGQNNKDRVRFLLGNHDIHYLLWHTQYFERMRGSGYNEELLYKVNNLYESNKDLFKVAWQKNNILVTHAGLCQKHYDNDLKKFHERYITFNIADFLNLLWDQKSGLLMKIGRLRYGPDKQGGIFWADKRELKQDPLQGFTQIVGHTPIENIIDIKKGDENFLMRCKGWKENTRLVFTDCLIYREDKEENPMFFEMEIEENVSR